MDTVTWREKVAIALSNYELSLTVGVMHSKFLSLVIAAGWLLYPFTLQSIIHPFAALDLAAYVSGQPIPHTATLGALRGGVFMAIMQLGALTLIELVAMTLFYRRAQFALTFWPIPIVLIGIAGNAVWWFAKGSFSLEGALVGLTPFVLMVICESIIEKLGKDFVFGKNNRPAFDPDAEYA
jgi:hypothetical protein